MTSYKNKVKTQGVDDMVLISKLSNDEINSNLKKRYSADIIYTYISDVLISVNPLKIIPNLTTPEQVHLYRGRYRYELPPHIFALAEDAYRKICSEGENQCMIISGESGAGKTEASKLIMQYIAAVSGKIEGVERVKRIILESNPLLEAFGNAKTIRNNNSSRFGKYFEIQFDRNGDPRGGKITNYLLEKSRVVAQCKNERNFHIFYQLLAGASQQERDELRLTEPKNYEYMNKSGCYTVDDVDDEEYFAATKKSMEVIGITSSEQRQIFKILAAILWLGNVQFVDLNGKDTGTKDKQVLQNAAYLLGVDSQLLEQTFIYKTLNAGGSVVKALQNPDQASAIRDALSKALYDKLFDWLVSRINDSMRSDGDYRVISVLDIYGFEIFDKNGFEQLCINYANEKLQQIFIELTLKSEQEEYQIEGIKWEPIKYFNNKIVCDLIEETKPPGIMAIMDDVCKKIHAMDASKTDETFMTNLNHSIRHHHLHVRANDFTIKHYAGDVVYCSSGMTEKNKDTLFADLVLCMQSSTEDFVKNIFTEDVAVKKAPTSAGFKIKKSTQELVHTLKRCNPHYIRCIKPNESKKPGEFMDSRVKHQVEYLGLLENIKVRRSGFAYRHTYDKVFERFRLLSKKTWPVWNSDTKTGCAVLLEDINIDKCEWQCGKTKLFIRHPETFYALEEMRERKFHESASRIAHAFRSFKLRKYYSNLNDQAYQLLSSKKERRRKSINRAFIGDYIDFANNAQVQVVMKQYPESVLFTDKFARPMRNMLRGHHIEDMFILITNAAVYWLMRVKVKKQFEMQLIKRAPFTNIEYIGMSTFSDNFVLVKIINDDTMVGSCENKIEFLTILNDQYKKNLKSNIPREFATEYEYIYDYKKDKKKKIQFVKNDSIVLSEPLLESSSKGFTVTINTGLPANSEPKGRKTKISNLVKNCDPGLRTNLPNVRASPSLVYEQLEELPKESGKLSQYKRTPPPPPRDNRERLKVLYGYEAQASDEITIEEGDYIALEVKDESGWWMGENLRTHKKGLFPGNYTEIEH